MVYKLREQREKIRAHQGQVDKAHGGGVRRAHNAKAGMLKEVATEGEAGVEGRLVTRAHPRAWCVDDDET